MALGRLFALLALSGMLSAATDLENLAAIPAVAGAEGPVVAYLEKRLAGLPAEVDNTGSLTVTFGEGGPQLLLASGMDEPGFLVSGVTDEGYLQVQRLAEPPPSYQFEQHWPAQPVWVGRQGRPPLRGVVAAASVHFRSDRGYSSSARSLDQIFVDIGASSAEEVAAAGVSVLDPIALERRVARIGNDAVTGAWISSRAGAAVLLALADALRQTPPAEGRVTLAFLARQQFHNRGLERSLRRLAPDRVVLIRPGGEETPALTGPEARGSELSGELLELARSLGLNLETTSLEKLSFGPFPPAETWTDPEQAARITLGVAEAGTPVEMVAYTRLADVARLLAAAAGLDPAADWRGRLETDPRVVLSPPDSEADLSKLSELETLEALQAEAGVSGQEQAVRDRIRSLLPPWTRRRIEEDAEGNLIVKLGRGDPKAVFIAHMDEIGYSASRGGGFGEMSLTPHGGIDADLFSWRPLDMWIGGRSQPAVMLRTGAAFHGRGVGDVPGSEIQFIPPKRLTRLLGERISGRGLDDRIGCAVLIQALRRLEEGAPVWFVWSVREEIGLEGAEALAKRISPRRVYAVDSLVTSDSPLEPRRLGYVKLGEGAAVRAMDASGLSPRAEVERVLAVAREKSIPARAGVTAGGNDGSKFVVAGAANVPLSFPLRYSHTAVETADLRDVRALLDLVVALVEAER